MPVAADAARLTWSSWANWLNGVESSGSRSPSISKDRLRDHVALDDDETLKSVATCTDCSHSRPTCSQGRVMTDEYSSIKMNRAEN